MAIEPGDWRKIHTILTFTTIKGIKIPLTEEGVNCWCCNVFLLASPDDDIDPVKPGDDYDKNIYHTFARPDGWEPPRQEIISRAPRKEDWIVVWEEFSYDKDEITHKLYGAEGKIVRINDNGIADVLMAGYGGLGKTATVPVPIKHLRVIRFETFVIDCEVKIIRGKYRNCVGKVISFKGAEVTVDINSEPPLIATLPMEHLHRTSFD